MKKLLCIIFSCTFILAGCGEKTDNDADSVISSNTATTTTTKAVSDSPDSTTYNNTSVVEDSSIVEEVPESIETEIFESIAEKHHLEVEEEIDSTVTVTLPAIMIGDDPQAYADGLADQTDRVISATANDDGSVTAVFTEEGYQLVCAAFHDSSIDIVDDIISSGKYPNITDIQYNDDFTEFNVTVEDPDLYEKNIMGKFYLLNLKAASRAYHIIMQMENTESIVHVYDSSGVEFTSTNLNEVGEE